MPESTRYVLALAVMVAGFYGAWQFRLGGEVSSPSSAMQAEPAPAIMPSVSRAAEPDARRQPPLAVLIDTDRQGIEVPSPQAHPPVETPPGVESEPVVESDEPEQEELDAPLPELDAEPGERFSLADARTPAKDRGRKPTDPPVSPEGVQNDVEPVGPQRMPEPLKPPIENAAELADQTPVPQGDEPARAVVPTVERFTGRHRIIEGDTLPKLAASYLGDSARYVEIFHVNREVLGDPRLLPIGVELKIPQGPPSDGSPLGALKDVPPEQQFVPVPENEALADDGAGDLQPIPPQSLPPREEGTWRSRG